MSTIIILLKQVITMFVLAFVGFVMFRTGKITSEGSKSLGNILIYLSLPCVIINSFLVERTPEKLQELGLSAVLALFLLLIIAVLSRFVLGRNAIDNFAGTFSNPGFFGIPLITASLSNGAVFYVAAFIAFINLGQWTYGVWLLNNSDHTGNILSKKDRFTRSASEGKAASGFKTLLIRLVKAPFMIAILIGLFFFLTGIKLPEIPEKCINFIANLNTPLAMFTIGIYLAQTDLKKMFVTGSLYKVSLVRMILSPLAAVIVLSLVPETMIELKLALLIVCACPVGSNVAVYAQLHNRDYAYAVETVVISTMLSIITIPAVVAASGLLWVPGIALL